MELESRKLVALLSSLISQLMLLLLLIFPSNSSISNSNSNSNSNSDSVIPLIHHFLFSHQVAVTLSRKRKRKREPDSDKDDPFVTGLPTRSPDSFRNCFMMTSSTFEWLAGLLEPLLDCRDPAELFPLNLTAGVRLGIGLFRLANGSDYTEISNRFGVSVSVARFCVKQLCRVLCTNFRFWVSFPNHNELESVSKGFEGISGLPNCCGVVECSRFGVVNAATSNEECVAAQIVVDSSWRILSIVAGFLGDKSNSRILKASTLFKDIEGGLLLNANPVNSVNQYLIGDSGYPLLPWLMVPFVETVPGSVEGNFNAAHDAMRLPALRTVASLKNWGVLNRPVCEELKMAVAYIGACSILHNSLLMREDFSALAGGFEDYCHQNYTSESCRLEDDHVTSKALVMRNTLASMAKRIHNSNS
ncbi:protein ALP1-like [Gastrolobium bilobum]|uniref:protein ALP1-like n=1 Tax=Gastrolobium bilobum TaxID=150636 RepID=UPI002AB2EC85|nr:protein ALP1-like [Gastrolobium bilobum]XP_061356357.1 protein ALP1-like [Gastrolobium bilobum]XP_061356362.1 protein ALP1-like [Gastrolobium bilobum]XP_061356367.1 protein ALP1-like [Gastrolobium bilobum]XP_061356372.1 protein ALP1-like [Gastrolobium bilobum]XP_061356377.1 protein ALP1-like [Gastrolobium bilobum]